VDTFPRLRYIVVPAHLCIVPSDDKETAFLLATYGEYADIRNEEVTLRFWLTVV